MNELLQLMHDTMSPVNRIKQCVMLLRTKTEGCLRDPDFEEKLLEYINTSAETLNQALDKYYRTCKAQTDPIDVLNNMAHQYNSVGTVKSGSPEHLNAIKLKKQIMEYYNSHNMHTPLILSINVK